MSIFYVFIDSYFVIFCNFFCIYTLFSIVLYVSTILLRCHGYGYSSCFLTQFLHLWTFFIPAIYSGIQSTFNRLLSEINCFAADTAWLISKSILSSTLYIRPFASSIPDIAYIPCQPFVL